MHSEQSREFMRRAVRLSAERMRKGDGGPFGAIIVNDGKVIAEGWNRVTSTNDPTAHAEVTAIRRACQALGTFSLKGCEIFTSCEPCPMCLGAVYWARLDAVYFAATRHDAARAGFDDARLYHEIALPVAERALPMTRLALPDALAAFDAWAARSDRVPY